MNANARARRNWYWSAALLIAICAVVSKPLVGQTEAKERTLLMDGRPVYEAVRHLEKVYGTVITYEDPQYLCPQDIQDDGPEVVRDYWKLAPSQRPKVLVPRSGKLEVRYDPSRPAAEALQRAIDAAAAAGFPTFRIEIGDHRINVVPEKARGSDCTMVRLEPALDTRITLREQERNGEQILHDIVEAVGEATPSHLNIWLGLTPQVGSAHLYEGVNNEIARAVLSRTLDRIDKNLSWALLCDSQQCALNIHPAPALPN